MYELALDPVHVLLPTLFLKGTFSLCSDVALELSSLPNKQSTENSEIVTVKLLLLSSLSLIRQ